MSNAVELRGTTCPLLKISREYDIDYDVVLVVADWYLHGRRPVIPPPNVRFSPHADREIEQICLFMRDGHHKAEIAESQGRLYFDRNTGKWETISAV